MRKSKEELRIVFMGTPEFAVESLKILVEGGYNVVGVVTMPDKPAGRGYKVQFSPVKQYALENNLLLLQPEKLKDGVNRLSDGEEIFYISNPALGLWALKKQFA